MISFFCFRSVDNLRLTIRKYVEMLKCWIYGEAADMKEM